MASKKSRTDVAYEILSKKKRAMQFNKLWEEVSKITGAPANRISQFYSDLILDSRFTSLKDNRWDLVERRKYAETHFDLSQIELEDDEPEEEAEDQNIVVDTDEY